VRTWKFWDWVAYACLFVAALFFAAEAGIKAAPDLAKHIPTYVGGSIWGFAPLILVLVATLILLIQGLSPRAQSAVTLPEKAQQKAYVTDINLAVGLTPQTITPVLLIGKAARKEQRLRILIEHSHYATGMGWGGWVSPQHVELEDLRDVYIGQPITVAIVCKSVSTQDLTLKWGRVDGPPVHAIQKEKKYRAVVRFIGSDGEEQTPLRFLLRRTSIDEPPYFVDVTSESEFGEWPSMPTK
jgi:hypothetical protein